MSSFGFPRFLSPVVAAAVPTNALPLPNVMRCSSDYARRLADDRNWILRHATDDGPHAVHGDCSSSWDSDCEHDCVSPPHDGECWQQRQRHNFDSVVDTRSGTRNVAAVDWDPRMESADADEEEKDECSVHTFEVADVAVAEMSVQATLVDDSIQQHLVEQKILE